jgi:Protein of unknown function (DUF1573)
MGITLQNVAEYALESVRVMQPHIALNHQAHPDCAREVVLLYVEMSGLYFEMPDDVSQSEHFNVPIRYTYSPQPMSIRYNRNCLKYILRCTHLLVGCFVAQSVWGQTELEQLLANLTREQKAKVLDYMHAQQHDVDAEIMCAYELLSPESQARTVQLLEASQPHANTRSLRTNVAWNQDTLNFDTIEAGTILIDSFIVMNTGGRPYEITGYQSACDCQVLRYPKYPVLSGEQAVIRVEFDTRNKSGHVQTGIVIQDNSIPNARTILYINGYIAPKDTNQTPPWER